MILMNYGTVIMPLIVLILLVQVGTVVFTVNLYMRYKRLRISYGTFMRGKDGKNLEESLLDHFHRFDGIEETVNENKEELVRLKDTVSRSVQKFSMVKYNAFDDMDGNLSFVLTLLDGNHNGVILNVLNTGDGNYLYLKEILKGESYMELSDEEKEGLERALYQDTYDIKKSI